MRTSEFAAVTLPPVKSAVPLRCSVSDPEKTSAPAQERIFVTVTSQPLKVSAAPLCTVSELKRYGPLPSVG